MHKIILLITLLFSVLLFAQEKANSNFKVHIQKTDELIKIDGNLSERTWNEADVAKDFYMIQPDDDQPARQQSEAKLAFDDNYLYIAVIFYHTEVKGPYSVESYKRDFSFNKNDNLLIAIDPFNNLTTGFSFGLNAYGAQWDGTMYNGGRVDLNWDTKWTSAVRFDNEKWVAELAIPFSVIRYKEDVDQWGINFGRLDLKANEKSAWAPVPKIFPSVSLAYTGNLIWDTPPPKQNRNKAFIPYLVANSQYQDGVGSSSLDAGADFKIGIGESMNLDFTLNPDFSNVEVDQEATNLDRFELFFPEKRQFFLENADLFSNFGYDRIRPFFSRRIGLDVPIVAGMRLSGNLSENTRIGVMDIQTKSDVSKGLAAENFAVFSVQQKLFERSNLGLILVNKQALNFDSKLHDQSSEYNRTMGLEYNYASSNNHWDGKLLFLSAFSPEIKTDRQIWASHLSYTSNNWFFKGSLERVGAQIDAQVGYIPRVAYWKWGYDMGYLSYLKNNNFLVSHGPKIALSSFYNFDNDQTDHFSKLSYFFNFTNRSNLSFFYNKEFIQLQSAFDPTRFGIQELLAGSEHRFNSHGFNFQSKPQSLMTYSIEFEKGGFFQNGQKATTNITMGYRFQPYVNLSALVNYNNIQMPAPWNENQFWLIGAKSDITFTRNLFFTNIFQHNNQKKLWAFNSRLQWRYQEASDLFIVFNSREEQLIGNGKNWSLSFKINYWLNP